MANIHLIVKGANEAAVDPALIQTFLLYYVKSCNSYANFLAGKGKKRKEVFYQNKVNLSLTITQGLGYQAPNC